MYHQIQYDQFCGPNIAQHTPFSTDTVTRAYPPQSNLPSKSRSDSSDPSDPWSPATSSSISGDTALDCLGTESSQGETGDEATRECFGPSSLYSCINLMQVKISPCRCAFQEYSQTHQISSFYVFLAITKFI